MSGFTEKPAFGKNEGKNYSTSKSESTYSESHTSTVRPSPQTLLPSEGNQPQVGGKFAFGSEGTGLPPTSLTQAPPPLPPTPVFGSDTESYEHVSIPRNHHHPNTAAPITPSGPITPQLSPRPPTDSSLSSNHATAGLQAPDSFTYEPPRASGISHDTSSKLAASNAAPGGPTYEPHAQDRNPATAFVDRPQGHRAPGQDTAAWVAASNGSPGNPMFETQPQEQRGSGIAPDLSSRLAGSNASPGGSTFEPGTKEHETSSVRQQRVGAASPNATDGGTSTGFNRSGDNRISEVDKASIGGGGVNASNTPTNTPSTGLAGSQPQGYVQQAKETLAPHVAKAQEVAGPYVAKVQETAGPYVAKVQETTGPYVAKAQDTVGPYVTQAQEAASPYVAKARDLGSSAIESVRPVVASTANQAGQAANSVYSTAAAELDARGVNLENTKQKLADAGQAAKDYGTVGQQRAGEYLQQAVDQAKNMDGENKSIVATIFGTVVLVWLAFGFSLMAMLALGVAAAIAALLARFSSKRVSGNTPGSGRAPGFSSPPSHTAAPTQIQNPGVETHFPKPSHPDNSLNNAAS